MRLYSTAGIWFLVCLVCGVAAVDWATLTAQQISELSAQAFAAANGTEISSIPPQSLVALVAQQFSAFSASGCSGLSVDQIPFISSSTFGGVTNVCIPALSLNVWSIVSSAQFAAINRTAISALPGDSFAQIPASSLVNMTREQGSSLPVPCCLMMNRNQLNQLPLDAFSELQDSCIVEITLETWTGLSAANLNGLSFRFELLGKTKFQAIPPASFSQYIGFDFDLASKWITPDQIRSCPDDIFGKYNPNVFNNFAIETRQAIRPTQMANANDGLFSKTSYDRVLQLSNATLAAVTLNLWNTLDSFTSSSEMPFNVDQLARLLSVAQLNYLADGRNFLLRSFSEIDLVQPLVQGIQQLSASVRRDIFTFNPQNRTDQTKWSFLQLLTLDCNVEGLPRMVASWLPDLQKSFKLPLAGLRPECFYKAFPTPGSIVAADASLVSQLQPQIFLSLTADYLNNIRQFSLIDPSVFSQVKPSVIGQLTLATWKRIPSIFIQKLNCDQCKAINPELVVELRNSEKSTLGTLYISFKIAMEPCGVYPAESDPMPVIVGVSVGVGVAFMLIVAVLVVRYVRAKRSLEYAPLIQN